MDEHPQRPDEPQREEREPDWNEEETAPPASKESDESVADDIDEAFQPNPSRVKSVRIGAGQGFYGDTPDGAIDVARNGDVKYICFDALAELTMAILQKDRMRNAEGGYTRDLPVFMRRLLPLARERGIRLITNAGGMNPRGAATSVRSVARELGMHDLRVGVVSGDDITSRIDALTTDGARLDNMDTHAPLDAVRSRVVFAVAYLGAAPIVQALQQDADVIVTGRVADASLFVAPMVHELGWSFDDWDKLAAGVVLGHLMECSGQATGGNFSGDWWNIPDLDRVGYPVCETRDDGTALLAKPRDSGGRVSFDTVKQQLLYEVLDPRRYMNPDVVADFTTVQLREVEPDVVEVRGARGAPRPDTLKVIAGYLDGWMGTAMIGYSWPDAERKARRAAELIEKLAAREGLEPLETLEEVVGVDSLHGDAAPHGDANEVLLRLAARFSTEEEASRFPRVAMPLALNGPPFIGGSAGPGGARALLGVWPSSVPRQLVEDHVTVEVMSAGESS
ncbi:MAG: acyclic terpene utilization AtuA family protein [Candidatus Dormibacteria bacterium]